MATKVKLIADSIVTTDQLDTASLDAHFTGGTGVTYSGGTISIGQAVHSTDSPTFADLTLTGNLNITGDINSYNVTDLDVTDKTITLGAGQIESNSGGSGIIVDGSGASILWDETNDQFDINKGISVTGEAEFANKLKVYSENNAVVAVDSLSNAYMVIDRSADDRRGALVFSTAAADVFSSPPATGTINWALGVSDSDELSGNKFAIKTGDTNFSNAQFVIDTSGNVGIGTTDPARELHVVSTGAGVAAFESSSAGLVLQGHSSDANIFEIVGYRQSDAGYHDVHIRSDSIGLIVKETTGNVGIGVTDPGQTLEIHNSDASDYTDFALRGTGHKYVIGVGNDSVATVNDKWYLYDNDNTAFRMVVDTSGNVGIGTDSPSQILHVKAASPNILLEGTNFPSLKWAGTDLTADAEIYYGVGGLDWNFNNYNNGRIVFKTNNLERLRIESSGNVEIKNGVSLRVYRPGNSAYGAFFMDAAENLYIRNSWAVKDTVFDRDGNVIVSGHIMGDDDTSYMRMNAGPSGGGAIYLNGSTRTNYENHIQYMADVHNFGDVDGSPINTLQVVSDSELVTINGRLTVTKPIQTTTDTGTRMYTGLATGSHYNSTGFLILDTTIPSPNVSGNNMFSIHINGYSYDNSNGGIIDLKVGTYSGESYFHNASYTGSNIPDKWVNNIRFARKTATNTVSIILGDSGTSQPIEIAATLFIQGYNGVTPTYAEGWDWKISTNLNDYTQLTKVNEKSTKRPSFSAASSGFSVTANWQVISDSMSQTHDGPDDDYNPSNGRFTPQLPGWYQFNFGGWATYNSTTGQERYAIAFAKNGSMIYLAGGNYSATDSPLAGAGQRIYLNGSTDYVELRAYSSVATQWGGPSHWVWWDGYWTGS